MSERHHLDGKPFYCQLCGLGYDEFVACELPDCELENEATARRRKDSVAQATAFVEARSKQRRRGKK